MILVLIVIGLLILALSGWWLLVLAIGEVHHQRRLAEASQLEEEIPQKGDLTIDVSVDNTNMDAQITLKLTPHEYDLIRHCIERVQIQQERRAKDQDLDHKTRDASRREAVELHDLLRKLR